MERKCIHTEEEESEEKIGVEKRFILSWIDDKLETRSVK